jgi:hypothetical protein
VHEEVDLGIKFTADLKPGRHIAEKTKKANQVLGQLKKAFILRDDTLMLNMYKAMVRPHLEYAVQVWAPHLSKDIKKLESIQRRATKLMPSCRGLGYEDRLKKIGISTLKERRKRGDMILTYKILTGKIDVKSEDILPLCRATGTRGHHLKLLKRRCSKQLRQQFFSQRVVDKWNGLPEFVISAETINSFKNRYDRHMTTLASEAEEDAFDWGAV